MANIDELLQQAESLLLQDLSLERDAALDTHPRQPEKYQRARDLFEQILKLQPDHKKAQAGLAACSEMLDPFHPVQAMAPSLSPGPNPAPTPLVPYDQQMPWEIRRRARGLQFAALAYTGEVFHNDATRYKDEALAIVNKADADSAQDPSLKAQLFDDAVAAIKELQKQAHKAWKGHGPEFLDDALAQLSAQLQLPLTNDLEP